jgi:hypothetical protein
MGANALNQLATFRRSMTSQIRAGGRYQHDGLPVSEAM